jgi:hypothetical protein
MSAFEACQLFRYAGMSNGLMSAGIYEINPQKDLNRHTLKLAAQMIWFFAEGLGSRKPEYPAPESRDYLIYRTSLKSGAYEITFYKNKYSERWWMEVPYPRERSRNEGRYLVPCSYADYQTALHDEVPDRWMKTYQKLM